MDTAADDSLDFTSSLLMLLGVLAPASAVVLFLGAYEPTYFAWSVASPLVGATVAGGLLAAAVLFLSVLFGGERGAGLAVVTLLAGSVGLAGATLLHLDALGGPEAAGVVTFAQVATVVWVLVMLALPLAAVVSLALLWRSQPPTRRRSGFVIALGALPCLLIVAVAVALFAEPVGAARWIPFAADPLDVRVLAAIQFGIGIAVLYALTGMKPRELGGALVALATYVGIVVAALVVFRDDIDWTSGPAAALVGYLAILAVVVLGGGIVMWVLDSNFPGIFLLPEVEPAEDYGFFGPDSVTWKVWSYPTSLSIGFQRSVVIEELDPALVASVTATQDIYDRPRTRYDRTLRYFAMVMFGDTRSTTKVADVLVRIHSKGIGVDPVTGSRYDANNPASQLWILLTAWHSILLAYETYGPGRLSAAEEARYWADCARAAELQTCDPADVPRDRDGVRRYFEEMRPQLVGSDLARNAMRHLLRAEVMLPPMSFPLRPVSLGATAVLRRGTLATMPRWMREMGDLPTGRLLDAVVRPVLRLAFRVIDLSARVKLMFLRVLSPATLPLGARVLLKVPPASPVTMTPREAQAAYGYEAPARAHAEFRAKQHRRVFGDGEAPSDAGIVESQALLGSID